MENNKYTDLIVEQIVNLCNIPSPSGFTQKIESYLSSQFQNMGYSVSRSKKHSVLVNLGGTGSPLVLVAHVDTLGAMVRAIKKDGRLRISKIGGFPENFIDTENCTIYTRDGLKYTGTFQTINPGVHVNKKVGETKLDDANIEIVIDEKVKTKEDVKELGINAGDFVSFDSRTVVTERGFIKSRHLDDKASAGIFIGLARFLKENPVQLKRQVYLLFTVYEEVGHGASAGIPDGIDEIISVDMGVVGDDLETDEFKVSICAKDSMGPYDYEVTNKLINLAKELNLNYAVDIYPFYGSDANAALRAGCDARHALIGAGVFASHGYERTHKEGLENTFRLLVEYIQK